MRSQFIVIIQDIDGRKNDTAGRTAPDAANHGSLVTVVLQVKKVINASHDDHRGFVLTNFQEARIHTISQFAAQFHKEPPRNCEVIDRLDW